jgi:hypothetical protein
MCMCVCSSLQSALLLEKLSDITLTCAASDFGGVPIIYRCRLDLDGTRSSAWSSACSFGGASLMKGFDWMSVTGIDASLE